MEHYFNYQCQFLNEYDVKAQKKPPKKRKKLGTREYLQPIITEHDEDENSSDDQIKKSYRKKLKCIFEAAKSGMKEGMLTGVFFGGCWGIFKLMQGPFHFGILGFNTYINKPKDLKSEPYIYPFATSSTKGSMALAQVRTSSATDSNMYMKKSVSETSEKFQEKKSFITTTDQMFYNVNYKKLPIHYNDCLPLSAALLETNKFIPQRKKVEIVGYAFIQTTGSITSSEENGSGSQRNADSATTTNEGNSSDNTPRGSKQSPGGSSSKIKGSQKTSQKSGNYAKSSGPPKGTAKKISGPLLNSTVGSKNSNQTQLEFKKSILSDLAEESPDETRNHKRLLRVTADEKPVTENADFLITDDLRMQKNKIGLMTSVLPLTRRSIKSDFKNSKARNFLPRKSKQPSQSSLTVGPGAKEKIAKKRHRKDTFENFRINQKISDNENIYPSSKKVASIFVDIDEISNGFISPLDSVQSADVTSYESFESRPSLSWVEPPHGIEKVELRLEDPKLTDSYSSLNHRKTASTTETEDYEKYRVETSPAYGTSFFRASTEEGKKGYHSIISDTAYEIDPRYERYIVETSPVIKKSLASTTNEGRQDEMSNFSKTLLTNSTSSIRYSHYDTKALTSGVSSINFKEKKYLDGETPEEKKSISSNKKDELRDLPTNRSHINEKKTVENHKLEDKSPPQHGNFAKETPTNALHPQVKSGNTLFLLPNGNPPNKKSYTNETAEIKRYSPDSTPSQKSNISETHERMGYSPESISSQKLNISETGESMRFSSNRISSLKFDISEMHESKGYSPESISSQKFYINEMGESKGYSPESISSQKLNISETGESMRFSSNRISSLKFDISEMHESKGYSPESIPGQKFDIRETGESKKCSSNRIPSQKFDIRETHESKGYSPENIPGQKFDIRETGESKKCSSNKIPSQKFDIRETHESKGYSPESISSQKLDISDTHMRNADGYSRKSSLILNKSYVTEHQKEISSSNNYVPKDRPPANESYEKRNVTLSDGLSYNNYATGSQSVADSATVYGRPQSKAEGVHNDEIKTSNTSTAEHVEVTAVSQQIPMDINDSIGQTQRADHSYIEPKESANASKRASAGLVNSIHVINEEPQPKKIGSEKMPSPVIQEKSKTAEEKKIPQEFNENKLVNENILVMSACNCALVLGVVCSVLSTTRATLAV